VSFLIQARRLRLFGHVARLERIPRRITIEPLVRPFDHQVTGWDFEAPAWPGWGGQCYSRLTSRSAQPAGRITIDYHRNGNTQSRGTQQRRSNYQLMQHKWWTCRKTCQDIHVITNTKQAFKYRHRYHSDNRC